MDPSLRYNRRYQLHLGKYPIVEVNETNFVLKLSEKQFLRITRPPNSDIRLNDILTLYTEVLAQERPNG